MTEKDLREIKFINLEIKRINNILNSITNDTALKQKYIQTLNDRKDDLLKKKIKAEQFIKEIDDAEIRLILTLKFIDLRSWNYISRTIHYDRSTIYKKFKAFMKNSSK